MYNIQQRLYSDYCTKIKSCLYPKPSLADIYPPDWTSEQRKQDFGRDDDIFFDDLKKEIDKIGELVVGTSHFNNAVNEMVRKFPLVKEEYEFCLWAFNYESCDGEMDLDRFQLIPLHEYWSGEDHEGWEKTRLYSMLYPNNEPIEEIPQYTVIDKFDHIQVPVRFEPGLLNGGKPLVRYLPNTWTYTVRTYIPHYTRNLNGEQIRITYDNLDTGEWKLDHKGGTAKAELIEPLMGNSY